MAPGVGEHRCAAADVLAPAGHRRHGGNRRTRPRPEVDPTRATPRTRHRRTAATPPYPRRSARLGGTKAESSRRPDDIRRGDPGIGHETWAFGPALGTPRDVADVMDELGVPEREREPNPIANPFGRRGMLDSGVWFAHDPHLGSDAHAFDPYVAGVSRARRERAALAARQYRLRTEGDQEAAEWLAGRISELDATLEQPDSPPEQVGEPDRRDAESILREHGIRAVGVDTANSDRNRVAAIARRLCHALVEHVGFDVREIRFEPMDLGVFWDVDFDLDSAEMSFGVGWFFARSITFNERYLTDPRRLAHDWAQAVAEGRIRGPVDDPVTGMADRAIAATLVMTGGWAPIASMMEALAARHAASGSSMALDAWYYAQFREFGRLPNGAVDETALFVEAFAAVERGDDTATDGDVVLHTLLRDSGREEIRRQEWVAAIAAQHRTASEAEQQAKQQLTKRLTDRGFHVWGFDNRLIPVQIVREYVETVETLADRYRFLDSLERYDMLGWPDLWIDVPHGEMDGTSDVADMLVEFHEDGRIALNPLWAAAPEELRRRVRADLAAGRRRGDPEHPTAGLIMNALARWVSDLVEPDQAAIDNPGIQPEVDKLRALFGSIDTGEVGFDDWLHTQFSESCFPEGVFDPAEAVVESFMLGELDLERTAGEDLLHRHLQDRIAAAAERAGTDRSEPAPLPLPPPSEEPVAEAAVDPSVLVDEQGRPRPELAAALNLSHEQVPADIDETPVVTAEDDSAGWRAQNPHGVLLVDEYGPLGGDSGLQMPRDHAMLIADAAIKSNHIAQGFNNRIYYIGEYVVLVVKPVQGWTRSSSHST